jgi:asparagine synthase (glutamine-hydrolysing)
LTARPKLALFLSGGLDSRLILAELLRQGYSGELLTVTYGSPGTYDYEIGRLVAHHAGVSHQAFDLSQQHDYERLFVEQCLETDGMVDLLHAPNETYRSCRDRGLPIAVGYLSDVLAGAWVTPAMLQSPIQSEASARRTFWSILVRFSLSTYALVPALVGTTEKAYVEDMFEILDTQYRQEKWNSAATAVTSFAFSCLNSRFAQLCITKGSEHINYVFPFFDADWVTFWQAVPEAWRCERRLFEEFLRKIYPDLFALPVRKLQGRGLLDRGASFVLPLAANPEINIVDYAQLLRTDHVFAPYIRGLLDHLKKRDRVDGQ